MKGSTFSLRAWPLVFALAAAAAAPACGDAEEASTSTGSGGNNNAGTTGEGLPCDVAQVLANKCWSCHGAKPAGGAPMSLAGYDQLVAASITDPNMSNAALSVVRMKAMNMPPGGGVTAEEIAVLDAWVAAGTPKATCGTTPTDPFSGGVVCTSGKTWAYGEDVSDPMRLQMHPGGACNTCHAKEPPPETPPIFLAAGTVYPTGHEPDECYGIDGTVMTDVKVHLEDSAGNVYDLPVNATGNFMFFPGDGPFVPPYKAKVVSSTGERAMGAPQTSGDCNSCHTVDGNGAGSMAPGRIVIP